MTRERLNLIMGEHTSHLIMGKHTSQDMKTIEGDTDRDSLFGADEAIERGVVDEVLVNRAEVGA
jgi:ATP-dependent protease ClpP protease subunit